MGCFVQAVSTNQYNFIQLYQLWLRFISTQQWIIGKSKPPQSFSATCITVVLWLNVLICAIYSWKYIKRFTFSLHGTYIAIIHWLCKKFLQVTFLWVNGLVLLFYATMSCLLNENESFLQVQVPRIKSSEKDTGGEFSVGGKSKWRKKEPRVGKLKTPCYV